MVPMVVLNGLAGGSADVDVDVDVVNDLNRFAASCRSPSDGALVCCQSWAAARSFALKY